MHKILLVANTSWYLYNFRLSLIKALIKGGFHVQCASPADTYTEKLISIGAEYINLEYDNSSKNPFKDILFLARLIGIFKKSKPSAILSFTIKANIYGGIAARFLRIPIIANVSGLGSLFISEGVLSKLPLIMYRLGLSKEDKVFFQNRDDYDLFIQNKVISIQETEVLPGSGVDLEMFSNGAIKNESHGLTFLLATRLLKDKGVVESVEAIRLLKSKNLNVELKLLGQIWTKNPSTVKQHELEGWVEEGMVTYLGFTEDVRPFIESSDVVILPSYREGMARILLEAASMSKPIITTDAPGCREIVDDCESGFLCKPRNIDDLANKMHTMLNLSHNERVLMGKRGRIKMEKEFDEKIVINKYLTSISQLINK